MISSRASVNAWLSMLDEPRTIYPDVRVVEQGIAGIEWKPTETADAVAIAEPLVVKVGSDPVPQAFVEIIEPDSSTLVTVIEFLSPSNKLRGGGRDSYQQKQRELYAAKVSLAEVDLVRSGSRAFLLPEVQFPPRLNAAYFACVFRGWFWDRFELYPISLRGKLPAIRIPLRRQEPDIVLNLQTLIEQAYRNGRYDRLDYKQPCAPPLEGEDAAWADEQLRAAGRR